jgi:alkyldihydroxyacetonephosphate synthase
VKLGQVHVVASDPIVFDDKNGTSINNVVLEIQRRQAKNIFVSEYHVAASSQVLDVEPDVVRRAFEVIGAKKFPNCQNTAAVLDVSSNESENLSILFQMSPLLAPLLASVRPKWSHWLWANHGGDLPDFVLDVMTNQHVAALVKTLLAMFDKADQCVDAAVKTLNDMGFIEPKPRHILQTALRDTDDVPALLLQASIDIRSCGYQAISNNKNPGLVKSFARSKVGDEEALGYWGFYESQFVLQMDADGSTFVRMDGNHYSLRGKKISGLLSFIAAETAISVDPFNEAFVQSLDDINLVPCKIQGTALKSLKLEVPNISQKNEDRIRHGTGHSQEDIYLIRSKEIFRVPDLVVRPASVSEVESLIKFAKLNEWCVIPFGGGTNVSNALRCPSHELEPRPIVSLDMRDLCQILWIDEENGIAHVEAGITGRQLEQGLAIRGYTMGHEPDSIEFSTLGGWIATKASGMKRNKYGNIEDIVKSVCVMGPDGVLKHGSDDKRHVWGRESCGIDLRNLILGSEGCMGVITSASIRICRIAESKDYDSILFYDFQTGLRFVREVARLGSDCPASVRLLDNEHFRLGHALRPDANSVVASFTNYCFGSFVKWKANFDTKTMVCATLLFESNTAEVKRQKRAIQRISDLYGGVRLGSAAGRASYELTFMIAYIRDFALSYYFLGESFETFAPWSQIETIITETKAKIHQEHEKRCLPGKPFIGCRVTQLYHEGACLYFYFCMNFAGVPNTSAVYSEIEHEARSVILANGGSLSHHHGIGKLRASFLPTIDSEPFRGVVHKLKHAMDPDNIFGARNGGFSG